MGIVHWDEVKKFERSVGTNLGGTWSDLGRAAGTKRVGLRRIELGPGGVPTPAHVHSGEEEIFYVLAGSGLSWQDGETYEVRAGDCLVHHPLTKAHTLKAGDDGLDVLAFGERVPIGGAYLPRGRVYWLYPSWAEVGVEPRPFAREPPLELPPAPSPRPPSIVNLEDVEPIFGGRVRALGRAAGAERTGLNHAVLDADDEGAPPHCHSAEEEIFVFLDGDGTLELEPSPARAEGGVEPENHALSPGVVVARPAGTGICHSFHAGDVGLTYLAYGTREPNDITYYPRDERIFFRGVGVIAQADQLGRADLDP
jgi:uncharacterized cupin superfamily protein